MEKLTGLEGFQFMEDLRSTHEMIEGSESSISVESTKTKPIQIDLLSVQLQRQARCSEITMDCVRV